MANDLTDQLRQIRLFAELRSEDLKAISELIHRQRLPAGAVVCRQGERGHRAYIVESGELRVLHVDPDGIEQEVARLGPGGFLGETSLLLGEPRDATVEVARDATLLCLDKEDFDQLLGERPSMLDALQMSLEVEQKWRAPRFEWQDLDEVVVFLLHKHPVILLRGLALPGFTLLLLLISYWYLGIASPPALVVGGLLSAIPVLFALYRIIDHVNDNYILTNKRVVHDERVLLTRQSRVGAPLRNIQSVREVRQGLLAQSFDFGDLLIETAGEPGGFVAFRQIPDPVGAQGDILEQVRRAEARARAEERTAIRDALRRRFGEGSPAGTSSGEEDASSEPRSKPGLLSRLRVLLRLLGYLLPALRYEEGDTITWRKHWVALIRPIWPSTALIALATLFTAWFLSWSRADVITVLVIYGAVLTFTLPWWLWIFDDWRNDVYQVTAARIVDVERLPFALHEERREASLDMIQNVNLEIPSLLGRLLNYGSVTIETAGAGAFTFDCVKNPRDVQNEIFRRMEAFGRLQREREARRRRDELLDWFTIYDQMRPPSASGEDVGSTSPGASQEASAEGRDAEGADADARPSSQ